MLLSQLLLFAFLTGAFLGVPAVASAGTSITCEGPCSWPYQRWADEAKIPTPELAITVVESAEAGDCGAYACTRSGTATIWLNPAPFDPWHEMSPAEVRQEIRETFDHELGHNDDYYALQPWQRERFLALRGDTREWRAGPDAPAEQFAEAWRICAEQGTQAPPHAIYAGYGYRVSPPVQASICRMLAYTPSV